MESYDIDGFGGLGRDRILILFSGGYEGGREDIISNNRKIWIILGFSVGLRLLVSL